MSPFSKANQLVRDLELDNGAPTATALPGYPSIMLSNTPQLRRLLKKEFWCEDLETIAPRLWIMTTFSSANINPLHRQRVKDREIVVTEEVRLHLVWIHNRIFIKPLPRYLLSHAFWATHLAKGSDQQDNHQRNVYKAATGFLRTYRYLVQHESDFRIAQQDHLCLVPKDVDWPSFCRFVSELDRIEDSTVSRRYCYGELRLTRLNFYAPLLLRRFHFEQVHGQYGDFFGRLYGPILFAFAVVSTILNSMQVALATEQLEAAYWESVRHICWYFSVGSFVGAATISSWFILLWLWIFLDEWIYTMRRKFEKKRGALGTSSC